MYAYVCNYWCNQSKICIRKLFFALIIRKWQYVIKRNFPTVYYLTKVVVGSFYPFIILFSIDILINLLTTLLDIFEEKFSTPKVQLGILVFVGNIIAEPKYVSHNIIVVVNFSFICGMYLFVHHI